VALVTLNGTLERIADAGSAIGSMVDNIKSVSGDTTRIEDHAELQEDLEPVGRLAGRFPGRAKRQS
jgi:hypothetical protein